MRSRSQQRRRDQEERPTSPADAEDRSTSNVLTTIYMSPTVDTLDTTSRTRIRVIESPKGASKTTPFRSAASLQPTPQVTPVKSSSRPPPAPTPSKSARSTSEKRPWKNKSRDFQFEQDAMTVTTKTLDLVTRTAFEPIPPPSLEEWHYVCSQTEKARNLSTASIRKRISPSLQHLELLHRLKNITSIRQLAFSPSLGLNSDVFVPWDDDLKNKDGESKVSKQRRKRARLRRDGRYRSIDPIQSALAMLPKNPPLLSHCKVRLPLRADVGFPNASAEEIETKQSEIAQEVEWEETSPRLVVLVTADDLGTAIIEDASVDSLSDIHRHFNGGGLEGMPLAGKELIIAKERNRHHFGGPLDVAKQKVLQPNRCSMLAPPLDSTFSSSLGWRPRPFHDHPPGMVHCLVCPLQVEFDVGNLEPLVGSLALYSLPANGGSHQTGEVFGKMSEEFYFPVGDWKGRIDLDGIRRADGTIDPDLLDAWFRRKHKGLFAFDPLCVSGEPKESLHLVLQIYKAAQWDPISVYLAKGEITIDIRGSAHKRKSIGSRIRKRIGKMKKVASGREGSTDPETMHTQASATFDTFGTQFLTPLCFGVCPLYPDGQQHSPSSSLGDFVEDSVMSWPEGATQSLQLYSFSSEAESQEEFLDRVTQVAWEQKFSSHEDFEFGATPSDGFSVSELDGEFVWDEAKSVTSSRSMSPTLGSELASNVSLNESADSRKHRFFKSQRYSKSSTSIISSVHNESFEKSGQGSGRALAPSYVIAGNATVFSSEIGVDFTQSMLHTPRVLVEPGWKPDKLPHLLVDASGRCAIMVNPTQAQTITGVETSRKRSDLIRLPPSLKPSGYVDASEVRELLYLAPRPEKRFDFDSPPSHRSNINLLYLYPRSLKLSSPSEQKHEGRLSKGKRKTYSVRIQLIRSSSEEGQVGPFQEALELCHNPVPWSGKQLLKAIYTKIPEGFHSKNWHAEFANTGVCLRDEIKMRLPAVLDGTHSLQFTLFAIEICDPLEGRSGVETDSNITVDSIAETTIPLTSSSTREGTSGVRITTVIPNGNHRIKLGDFQLQVETRLISSIHVSDTAVATALRDFPFMKDHDVGDADESLSELSLVPSRSIVGKSPSSDPIVDLKVPFHRVFSAASEHAVFSHFHSLLYMHLCNLVCQSTAALVFPSVTDTTNKHSIPRFRDMDSMDARFILDNFRSLFEIIRKAKLKVKKRAPSTEILKLVECFIKNVIDSFDEAAIIGSAVNGVTGDMQGEIEKIRDGQSLSSDTPEKSVVLPSQDDGFEEDEEEILDGGAVRFRKKTSSVKLDSRVSRIMEGIPFSRVAFGASKTDRMRLEAEMYQEASRFTHLFDDDETVATFLTAGTEVRPPDGHQQKQENNRNWDFEEEDVLRASRSDNSLVEPSTKEPRTKMGLAKRVRTAAHMVIAPCMAPELSAVLATNRGDSLDERTRTGTHSYKERGEDQLKSSHRPADEDGLVIEADVTPGSDVDDEQSDIRKDLQSLVSSSSGDAAGVLRGPLLDSVLPFMLGAHLEGRVEENSYLYEVIIAVWLSAWADFLDAGDDDDSSLILLPTFDPSESQSELLLSFYIHMDMLLPLCLKSFLLRCNSDSSHENLASRVILDRYHMQLLEPFVEILAQGILAVARQTIGENGNSNESLLKALSSSELVVEFLLGLGSVLNPFQLSILIKTYIQTLRKGEAHSLAEEVTSKRFVWDECTILRVLASRHLRLRAVEQLSSMPNFVSMNYPLKFKVRSHAGKARVTSWTQQYPGPPTSERETSRASVYSDGFERLPRSGWLAEALTNESLSICSLSCQAVVAEAIAQLETTHKDSTGNPSPTAKSLMNRPGASLDRNDLLRFQSTAIHAINCAYELLLRRHAMDSRFQTEQARSRIAAMFTPSILEKSIGSVRWLTRMEATHKVRSTWLLCFLYVLQEAPDAMLRSHFEKYCGSPDFHIHKIIRLLRLSSSTFQAFSDAHGQSLQSFSKAASLSPWLLQESFNTICASLIMIVDVCVHPISYFPKEEEKMAQGVIDLLLHILTAPQSAVTLLRTVGGAIQALNKLGVELFLETVGSSLQHWVRILLSLMNSVSLSVRSIAVDFVISLLGESFKLNGNVDEVTIVFATIMPEVVAREIALYAVDGLVTCIQHVESAVWPLRRALADIEEANPLDDDRVDPQLMPSLSMFCRACQAIIDGVIVELRLSGPTCTIVGSRVQLEPPSEYRFDADEESLYEAAAFFASESAPLQRLRWLFTLKALHEAKSQWVEAAETLILCARTISEAMPHLRSVWRPSRFVLWYDSRRSLWLSSVGQNQGHPNRGNAQVMEFVDQFLEPLDLIENSSKKNAMVKLAQPNVQTMCKMLISVSKKAVEMYLKEGGMEDLASSRLDALLRIVIGAIDNHSATTSSQGMFPSMASHKRVAEETAALQEVSTSLNSELTNLSERLLNEAKELDERSMSQRRKGRATESTTTSNLSRRQYHVRVVLSGKKPARFKESTTIPTFLEWNNACICRVPSSVVTTVLRTRKGDQKMMEEWICSEFGRSLRDSLSSLCPKGSVMFTTEHTTDEEVDQSSTATTFLSVSVVHMSIPPSDGGISRDDVFDPRESKHFFYRKSGPIAVASMDAAQGGQLRELRPIAASNLVELTVAHPFPCALSRQRTLITSEFLSDH